MALDKVTVTRIAKLIAFMEKLPRSAEKHFSMKEWVRHKKAKHNHGIAEGKPVPAKALLSCGTTACALGWGTAMPYFKRLGLCAVPERSPLSDRIVMTMKFRGVDVGSNDTRSSGFLHLTDYQSGQLFGSHNRDKTPKAWAARASRLLKEWQAA